MPTLNATGLHVNSAGSSFNGIRGSASAKTANFYNPGTHTATLELSLRNTSGASYFRSHVMIAFNTSGITELPSSATINLAIDSGTTATNVTAASHLFKIWQDDGTSGLSQNGFHPVHGYAGNANGGYWNDFTGWHTSNSWATAGVEFGSFSLQNAIDAAAAADNKLTITLTAAALQKMVDEDIFIVHFSEHNHLGLNLNPGASSGVVAVVGLSAAVGSFTDDFTPFISYEESVDFPNAENESGALVGGDFTINTFSSAVLGAQFAQAGEQVPFSLGTPGARHLRGRLTAYAAEKGDSVKDKDGSGKKGKKKKDE